VLEVVWVMVMGSGVGWRTRKVISDGRQRSEGVGCHDSYLALREKRVSRGSGHVRRLGIM
jgi:hypothetical protein